VSEVFGEEHSCTSFPLCMESLINLVIVPFSPLFDSSRIC